MRPIPRACAAAMLLCACTPAPQGQAAVETVAFLAYGLDTAGGKNDSIFRTEIRSNGADELRYQLFSVRSGQTLTDLTFMEVAPCKFTVIGKHFNSDVIIQRNDTLDFTSVSARQTQVKFKHWLYDNVQIFYLSVPGVEVCAKGETFNQAYDRSPQAGTCRHELQTSPFVVEETKARQLDALTYLRTNFCKPRAF